MAREEWQMCWQFVRTVWRQIDCGDLWHRLTPHQLFAAHVLFNREHSK